MDKHELFLKACDKSEIFFQSMSIELKQDLYAAGLDTFYKTDDFHILVTGCYIQGYLDAKDE